MLINGLLQILIFQTLGELISKLLLPYLPGPVIGLVLLVTWLSIKKTVSPSLTLVADALNQHLGLLFVPAAVGVVMFLPTLLEHALAVVVSLLCSVVLAISASAMVFKIITRVNPDVKP